jgi:hypothetical protein
MLAVLGVPQLLSSYFDHRGRRRDRLDNEASAERRHQESLEQRREERRLEEERRRQEEELRRQEMQLLRQDFETRSSDSERRHQEMMTLLIASINNGSNQGGGQNQTDLLRAMQQTIEELQAENDRLRQQNGHEE